MENQKYILKMKDLGLKCHILPTKYHYREKKIDICSVLPNNKCSCSLYQKSLYIIPPFYPNPLLLTLVQNSVGINMLYTYKISIFVAH